LIQPSSNHEDSNSRVQPGSRVLIAEDDPISRRVLQTWLQRWHYAVTAVEDGADAWNVLQNQDAPKLAILDWVMPGLDGIELCRRIRQLPEPYRYVILVTGRGEKQDVITGLEAGADDYLTKPFDSEELRARLRTGGRILDLQDALLNAQHALEFEAAHDALTALWNRRAILCCLEHELNRARRGGKTLGVMMADLDHFKIINDSRGHLVGDAVLHETARRLQSSVRSYDSVGRYGGEEFLVIISDCGKSALLDSAERLRHAVTDLPIPTKAGDVQVTISIGLALSSECGPDCEAVVRAADEALYLAKANGRNRVEVAGNKVVRLR